MIVKPIDLAMVQQMNEVSNIKNNENQKPMVDQQNIMTQVQKEVANKAEQVVKKDNADKNESKFDAKDKSNNEYAKDGKLVNRKKKRDDGKVFLKDQNVADFDIKI